MLPILYQNHDLIIYSYPLLMGLGWGIAYQVFFAYAKNLKNLQAQTLFWGIFLSSWLGAKLLFVLTSELNLPSNILSQVSFWTGGGFVFYGGLMGGLIFILLYKLLKFPLKFIDLWAMLPALTLGHAIGRIGCFLAGCCFGSSTDWWWGVHMHGEDRHPTQLIESLGLFLIAVYLLKARPSVQSFVYYLVGYGALRFGVEAMRGDEIRGIWGSLTPSQWISVVMILTGIFLKFNNNNQHLASSSS